jgi:hypothetical protein
MSCDPSGLHITAARARRPGRSARQSPTAGVRDRSPAKRTFAASELPSARLPVREITRWEHEPILEAVQRRLDENPKAMRQRRETVEHPFATIKARMGAMHFLMKTLPRVAGEMALHVLAYNLTRVMNIIGTKPLVAASGG